MMYEHNVKLKYTKTNISVCTYNTGIKDYINIDNIYRGSKLRDKVIYRVDGIRYLNKYFTDENITKYRAAFLSIIKDEITDPINLSEVIKKLLDIDNVFSEQIINIYHSCPEDNIFGKYLVQAMADCVLNAEKEYIKCFRESNTCVVGMENGYIYFAFDDNYYGPLVPSHINGEVVSYVKNWSGEFRYE